MTQLLKSLDRIGSIGALIAAVAAPCCFPLFAAIGAGLGLGALSQYEGVILYIFQGFAAITLIGLFLSFLRHRNIAPLLLGTFACALLGYHFYNSFRSLRSTADCLRSSPPRFGIISSVGNGKLPFWHPPSPAQIAVIELWK